MSGSPQDFSRVTFHKVAPDRAGQRIDNFLFTLLKGVPKSKVYRIVRKGELRVNRKRVKPDYRLQENDEIRLPPLRRPDPSEPPKVAPQLAKEMETSILLETDALIALNKPSGLAVHGGSGIQYGVIETLRSLRPKQEFLELVHRLDRETSGCLLIAKKRAALKFLHEQLRQGSMDKRYWALVRGQWPRALDVIEAPLLKNQTQSGERVVRVSRSGKPSETRYRVLERFADCSLVECYPVTGRTHQIRVHCQYAGHPIIGDDKYGLESLNKAMKEQGVSRLFLHAKTLSFRLQPEADATHLEAPLDNTLETALARLRQHS